MTRDGHRTFFKWHRARRRVSDPVFTGRRIIEGMQAGASVEVDLVVTADDGFAVLHNFSLEKETTGTGLVGETTSAVLRDLHLRDNEGRPIPDKVMVLEDLCELMGKAGVHPDADQVLSTSVDGFTAGTPVSAVLDPARGALLAIGMNGAPLPVEHGFPARLVVPGLYGYVSATKWVTDLELTTFAARQAYWVPRGYSAQAPVKTESRIDVPRGGANVRAGQVTVAGIAWAQHKGIAKVEVRVDGGPWQVATLSTEVSKDTWRMWRITVGLRPGSHAIEARATDDTGYTQTDAVADTVPNGATGWPELSVTAS